MPIFTDELIGKLTLEEKIALLAGASVWQTVAFEQHGIPAIKVSDGPNGARGSGSFTGGLTSACFPAAIGLAATWDTALIERVGQALAEETKSKSAQVLLAPTVNIHRSPLNGRNFECYSEDPFLTARLAVAYINGVQNQGISATVKHFVCNDSEFERHTISSEVGERALHEIYLAPFKAAVQEAKVWAIMSSYNRVNGSYVGDSAFFLDDILRKEWGFDGLVMSDWFGTQSTAAAIKAGLDLEMPGKTIWRGVRLLEAVERDEVAETSIDDSVRRLFKLIERTGATPEVTATPEQALDLPEHRALLREAAAEGMVLLKNQNSVLPLQPENLKSVAIIGPNAKVARISGGGSAKVNPHYRVTPFEGLEARLDGRVQIGYELGCTNHKMLPVLTAKKLKPDTDTAQPFLVEYFNNEDLSGKPVWSEHLKVSECSWFGQLDEAVSLKNFSARLSGQFTPLENGNYTFGLVSAGLSRFYLDGQELIDNWTQQIIGDAYFGRGSIEVMVVVALTAGQTYNLVVDYSKASQKLPVAGVRLGCLPPLPEDAIERAAKLAAESDVALVFVGLSEEWESESFDRPDIELVGEQVKLIEQVAAANPNTVVVINTGAPIAMNWLDKVAAVVQAWYPGQECGNAIADVLLGDVTPSGKLSQTFPKRLEDNPAYINYPGENGRVYYGEGLFVGYRYYEKKKIEPLFPFGFGLSYTTFAYSPLRLDKTEVAPNGSLQVAVDITNTGQRAGKEIVQLYIRDIKARLHRPEKELKGFTKVQLAPGQTKTVTLVVTPEHLAYYDDAIHGWVAEAGEFEVLVGASSQDIRSRASFVLLESI